MNAFLKSVVVGALALSSSAVIANDYIQFKNTDSKTFTSNKGHSVNQTVVEDLNNGWRKFSTFLGNPNQWVWSSNSSQSVYLYSGEYGAQKLVNFNDPVNTVYEVNVGACTSKATLETKSATMTTAAGTFYNVAQLSFTGNCYDAGMGMASFAPGVGLIQYSQQSIAGPIDYKFSQGSVAGKKYPQFSGMVVSAKLPTGRIMSNEQASVTAEIELTNKSGQARTLEFNSSKQFDIVIIDQYGVEVSRWSANKHFQTAKTYVTLSPGENHKFGGSVSLIGADGLPLDVGTYTLRIEVTGTDKPEASAFTAVPYAAEAPLYIDHKITLN